MPRLSSVLGALALAAAAVPVAIAPAQAAGNLAGPVGALGQSTGDTPVLKGNSTPLTNLPVVGGLLNGATRQSGLPVL